MKKIAVICLVFALLLILAACGARQEPLETWPIEYIDSIPCYLKSYPDVESMLAEDHIIFHGKAVRLVREGEMGVVLELESLESTESELKTIQLRQIKNPDVVLKKGEEVVLILHAGAGDGVWEVFNDTCGMFRMNQETGVLVGKRLDSLLESAPQSYSAKGGKDLTLEQVYDLLVEMDKAE